MASPTRVVIVGAGFGGVYAALELEEHLRRAPAALDVTLVSRDNYFLFTPMLHEVAASELEPSAIVNPLRKLPRRLRTFGGGGDAIDLERRAVHVCRRPRAHDQVARRRRHAAQPAHHARRAGVDGVGDGAATAAPHCRRGRRLRRRRDGGRAPSYRRSRLQAEAQSNPSATKLPPPPRGS
jgi:hypothetical protein